MCCVSAFNGCEAVVRVQADEGEKKQTNDASQPKRNFLHEFHCNILPHHAMRGEFCMARP
jgi:hypothetical protein